MGDATANSFSLRLPASVDVLVLGGGPAGLATAITLACLGQQVLLVARPDADGKDGNKIKDKIGESLAPAAIPILQQLGVGERFAAGGHLPCYGNKSAWGSATLRYHDFINDPNGHGWHIDRPLFERQLAERATAVGVQQTSALAIDTATHGNGQWQIALRPTHRQLTEPTLLGSRFVVDATGRNRWFARRQGVQSVLLDRQVALVAFLAPTAAPLADTTSLVEAVESGWWYSARLPDERLATMLMTDPDLHDRHQISNAAGWQTQLMQTHYTAARIQQGGYRLVDPPRLVAAESGRLDQLWGEGWVAVGDAAMTYDPLAAHGLTLALAGGRDAALAITAHLAGERDALAAYAWRLEMAYEQYAARRYAYYCAERRWPTAPYWARRQDHQF